MNGVAIQIMIDALTFVVSVSISAFIGGVRLGSIQGDVKAINERLARIEGMFTLRLRDPGKDQQA